MRKMNVCCVLVTYGERFHFLEDVVHTLLKQEVNRILIVDNGSAANSRDGLERLRGLFPDKIRTVRLPENTGSAMGYKTGLEEAYRCADCEFIWLLDDDNKPRNNALEVLFSTSTSRALFLGFWMTTTSLGTMPLRYWSRTGKASAAAARIRILPFFP